jgi:hypothetical protein
MKRSAPLILPAHRHPYDRCVRLRRLLLGGLLVFTLGFAVFALQHMLPPQPYGLADDWRVFYAAATVVQHGGNPYDASTIHAAEQAAQHYPSVQPSLDDFTDLPVVALLLRAVTWLPYWASFTVFTLAGAAAALIALAAWLRDSGWTRPALWLVAAMCSWVMLLGFFSGQFDALLLAGGVGGVLFMRRGRPWAAGLCMVVVLLKPHLLWPLPLLLFAVSLPDRRRAWPFAAAAAGVIGGGAALGFLTVPGSAGFFGHLLGFGSRVGAVQPDLSGLPGMLLHLPGGSVAGTVLAAVGAAAVVILAGAAVRAPRLRCLDERQRTLIPLAGLALWLAAAPYAHPNDDVLLFPLLALLIGADGRELRGRPLAAGLVATLVVAAAFITAPAAGYLVLAGGACLLVLRRRSLTASAVATAALVAIAVLPAVWPFHVLAVPVTPVAVTVVAVAALMKLRDVRGGEPSSVGQGHRRGRVGGVVVEPAPALAAQPARGN